MNELLAAGPIFSVSDDGDQLPLPVAYTIRQRAYAPALTESVGAMAPTSTPETTP